MRGARTWCYMACQRTVKERAQVHTGLATINGLSLMCVLFVMRSLGIAEVDRVTRIAVAFDKLSPWLDLYS